MTDIDRRRARSAAAGTPSRARSKARSSYRRSKPGASEEPLREQAAPASAPGTPRRRKKLELPVLDPKTSSDTAARLLLAVLGATMRAHEQTIIEDGDASAVHDLRVSVRRARTLLGQLRDVFPPTATKPLRDGLRHLAELSGPVRDLDILLETLEAARRKLPAADRDALEPLGALLASDRAQARALLVEALQSPRHARLAQAWDVFTAMPRRSAQAAVASAQRDEGEAIAASMPIAIIAGEAIERAWRRLIRHGRKIDDESPPKAIHQVRIDGKKLRYLLELFRPTYADAEIGPVISSLKDLQDCLGALNDTAVGEETLRELAGRLDREDGGSTAALVSVGRLIERASASQETARRLFPERLDELRSKENRKRIKSLAE